MTGVSLRNSTLLSHAKSHEQPFQGQGRKILPKGATPSITATSMDKKIDPVVSGVKAELRIHTYFIDSLLEILHNIPLNRGKTNKQGTRAPQGWQAGHACLAPETYDTRTLAAIQRIVKIGLTPTKTLPFLEHRISLTPPDALVLNDHHSDEGFVSEFITKRLPKDGMHSLLSDTRYNWNCNATFENPDESNEFDSRMEKAIAKFLGALQVLRLNGIDTAEESTEKLVVWLMDYYQQSIANLKQKEVDLTETACLFARMRKFELGHLYPNNLKNRKFDKEAPQIFCLERVTIADRQGTSEDTKSEVKPTRSKTDSSGCLGIDAGNIPEDEFEDYLKDLQSFLKHYDALIEKKTGCPSIKEIKNVRNDFKFLRKIALMLEKGTPTTEIISFYLSSRHLGKEMTFDRDKFLGKYKFYQEEAAAQMAAVDVFTEPCAIPHMQTALFGKMDAAGVRRAPSDDELKQQLLALSSPASPVKAKIAKRLNAAPLVAGVKRKAPDTDHPDSPMKKKFR